MGYLGPSMPPLSLSQAQWGPWMQTTGALTLCLVQGVERSILSRLYWVILEFACFFGLMIDFFQEYNVPSGSMCQIVWIQIRPNILLGLILVQTVCNGYQHSKPCSP